MNRVTHLLHKTRLLARQRRILSVFARHYVISADDITKFDKKKDAPPRAREKDVDIEKTLMVEKLLADFDVEGNEIDRRIYYEVMGQQLIENEFASYLTTTSSSSDSCCDDRDRVDCPIEGNRNSLLDFN